MPLEDILRKIEEEAELKKKRILEEARTESQRSVRKSSEGIKRRG